MTNSSNVLIVSTIADVATDDVVKRLAARGVPCRRVNTEDLPFASTITLSYGHEEPAQPAFGGSPLGMPSAIWYRRLRSPAKPDAMEDGIYEFCLRENRAAMLGGLLGVRTRWMSHPGAVWQAEHKPYQLAIASELGLRIPRTLVTNDIDAIRSAAATFGRIVVKPARIGHVVHGGDERAIFTSELLTEHLADLSGAELCPAIYQELVPKRFDIRVTVVGNRLFVAAIDSQSDPAAAVDWRRTDNPKLPHQQRTLPEDVQRRLLQLTSRLGLSFAAIDLIERADGEFIFLEVNPNGQWLWLDEMLELGISEAVAAWLAGA